jgi:hypothetical protein
LLSTQKTDGSRTSKKAHNGSKRLWLVQFFWVQPFYSEKICNYKYLESSSSTRSEVAKQQCTLLLIVKKIDKRFFSRFAPKPRRSILPLALTVIFKITAASTNGSTINMDTFYPIKGWNHSVGDVGAAPPSEKKAGTRQIGQ